MRFLKWGRGGPPDARAAMARLLVLKTRLVVGIATPPPDVLRSLLASWSSDERDAFLRMSREQRVQVTQALRLAGLWRLMSSAEQRFLNAEPTALTTQDTVNTLWLMESAECLLFALGFVSKVPPYDVQADLEDLKLLPAEPFGECLRGAQLRARAEIEAAREVAESWHWRSRTRQLQESDRAVSLPDGMTFPRIIKMSAEHWAAEGVFVPVGDDFPAFGRPYRDVSPEEWAGLTSIAMERHKALNWLCGYAPGNRWDETPTDT